MKRLTHNIILAALLLSCGFSACKKNSQEPKSTSSLIIVNAIPGSAALVPNFYSDRKLQYYKSGLQIAANSFAELGGYTGDYSLSLAQITDTTRTVYNGRINLAPNTFQTLFVTGTLAAPDSVFTRDDIKPVTDSAVNVRFINISTGSAPVNINLLGSQATPIVTNLAYKSRTAFLPFSAKKAALPANGNYVFEIRDATTAKLLTTYTLSSVIPTRIFRNVTLAFKGVPNGTGVNAQGTILVNNY